MPSVYRPLLYTDADFFGDSVKNCTIFTFYKNSVKIYIYSERVRSFTFMCCIHKYVNNT